MWHGEEWEGGARRAARGAGIYMSHPRAQDKASVPLFLSHALHSERRWPSAESALSLTGSKADNHQDACVLAH